ncbi:hypothetical protein UA08_06877 [Talaromyces atroroseus]|uniref:Transcription factor domain-containing protein n=1 Tax=Talaromyces atroroseus TaxID=1441469 RepID=A0A225AWS3_TALAT|nr:hypothetical protein UA08_06877 [Talaromyces atroroseus]OKL57947.1 hypothetical protein UA08_06877 [Talaromyces atroroseus]
MVHLATSSAIALGINLYNVDDDMVLTSKEARCRLWYSLFTLEHQLSTITGRPSCLTNSLSAYAPLPVEESQYYDFWKVQLDGDPLLRQKFLAWTLYQDQDQDVRFQSQRLKSLTANPPLYFFYIVDLSIIAQAISTRMYGASPLENWVQVERQVDFYAKKLDIWQSRIIDQFSIAADNGSLSREKTSLTMHYYSARIMLSRLCLSGPGINRQTTIVFPLSRLGYDQALVCIKSALSLIANLPEEPDFKWLYAYSPWWIMLHFLMQVAIVLLMQLSLGLLPTENRSSCEDHGKGNDDIWEILVTIPLACQKVLRWLRSVAVVDQTWQRGSRMCDDLFRRVTSAKQLEARVLQCFAPLLVTDSSSPHASELLSPSSTEPHSSPINAHSSTTAAENPGFQSDPDEPYKQKYLFPYNPLLYSDATWLSSILAPERAPNTGHNL